MAKMIAIIVPTGIAKMFSREFNGKRPVTTRTVRPMTSAPRKMIAPSAPHFFIVRTNKPAIAYREPTAAVE
jgi:hypothetical protein